MKPRLQRFTAFSKEILPHEGFYLQSVERFEDPENRTILQHVIQASELEGPAPDVFPEHIDKRKYSRLKEWIQRKLESIDVDRTLAWMQEMERQVLTDAITPEEEEGLLSHIQHYRKPCFYFLRFYELVRQYRQFLAIRLRETDHRMVDAFMQRFYPTYKRCQSVYDTLHEATLDITRQYMQGKQESAQWESWLREVFFDEEMDGQNRYYAAVRLTFLYLNYGNHDRLKEIAETLDRHFRDGEFYSRRLLMNYYANRLIVHAKFDEWAAAIRYGHLSLRHPTADYPYYLQNLGALLLRIGKKKEALELLHSALPMVKKSPGFHSRIGFGAFYMKCLIENGRPLEAEKYGEMLLRAYRKQILAQRWHLFFSAYLQALLVQKKYEKILSMIQRFKLTDREAAYRRRPGYLPTLTWFHASALYEEGQISLETLENTLHEARNAAGKHTHALRWMLDLARQLQTLLPEAFSRLAAELEAELASNASPEGVWATHEFQD